MYRRGSQQSVPEGSSQWLKTIVPSLSVAHAPLQNGLQQHRLESAGVSMLDYRFSGQRELDRDLDQG